MRMRGLVIVTGMVLLLISGCGGGDDRAELPPLRGLDPSTSTTGGERADRSTRATDDAEPVGVDEVDPKCAIFEEIIRLDELTEARLTPALMAIDRAVGRGDRAGAEVALQKALRDIQALSNEIVPPIRSAYDRLIEIDPELRDDVVALRDTTIAMLESMAGAEPTLEGFVRAIEGIGQERAVEAAAATYSLDVVSRRDCGLVIAN